MTTVSEDCKITHHSHDGFLGGLFYTVARCAVSGQVDLLINQQKEWLYHYRWMFRLTKLRWPWVFKIKLSCLSIKQYYIYSPSLKRNLKPSVI